MKRVLSMVLIFVLLAVTVGCGGAKGVNSSPKSVVEGLFASMEKGDADLFLKCFTKNDMSIMQQSEGMSDGEFKTELSNALKESANNMQAEGIKLSDIQIKQPEGYKDMTTVSVEATFDGEVENIPVFKGDDGKWYINVDIFNSLF